MTGWLYDDASRLQGGKCAELSPAEFDRLFMDGPAQAHARPEPARQGVWDYTKDRYCIECPIFLACREQSMGEPLGVFGGTDQYERYKWRKKRSAQIMRAPKEERLALGRQIYELSQPGNGLAHSMVCRKVNLAPDTVTKLRQEYEEDLAERKREKQALTRAAQLAQRSKPPVVREPTVQFPEEQPPGGKDAWVRDNSFVWSAWYVAQSADGTALRMKVKNVRSTGMIKWFPASDVDLRRPVVRLIEVPPQRYRRESDEESAESERDREAA